MSRQLISCLVLLLLSLQGMAAARATVSVESSCVHGQSIALIIKPWVAIVPVAAIRKL